MRSFASSSGATKSSQVGRAFTTAFTVERPSEKQLDRGRDVLGLDVREARQAGKIKQRVGSSREAARMQFSSSIAMVIGPTPPGTGVIQPATSFTASKSTSPASLPSGGG